MGAEQPPIAVCVVMGAESRVAVGAPQSSRIVGRSAELRVVLEAVDAAAVGDHRSLVMLGEAGIGKSTLRRAAERRARECGLRVLSGRAIEREPRGPYAAVAEAVGRGLGQDGWLRDPSLAAWRPTLAHIVPEWSVDARGEPSVPAVAEAVLRLLAVAARQRPALLVVEDLHWADPESLATLSYLVENIAEHRVSCLLTSRPEAGSDALRVIRRLVDSRTASLLELHALGPAEVDRMTLACLGQDAAPTPLLLFVRERADGVPFLVEELLAGLVGSGALVNDDDGWRVIGPRLSAHVPATLAELIAGRLRSMHPRSQQVVEVAALLGRRIDLPLLTTVTGLAEDVVLASLREATYAQLLVADEAEIRFRHALTREHVLSSMLPPERARLADRAGRTVEDRYPGLPGAWCEIAAELCELAGDLRAAVRHLSTVAARARDRGAVASAAAHLERALALLGDSPEARDVLERLTEIQALAGDVDGALRSGRAATALLERDGDAPVREFDLQLSLARAQLTAGMTAEAADSSEALRRRARQLGDGRRLSRATVLAAQVAVTRADLRRAELLAEEVLTDLDGTAPEVRCEALEVLGRCRRIHDIAGAEAAFAAAHATARQHGLLVWEARALHELGTIDLLDTLRTDRLRAARRAAVAVGAPATIAVVDFHLASLLVSRGDVADARAAAERAVALSRRLRLSLLPVALTVLARCHAHERRIAEMEATIEQLRIVAPDDPVVEAGVWSHARAMLALHQADREGARAALDRASALLTAHPGHHDPHRGLWALLCTLHGDGDGDGDAARAAAARAAGSDTRMNKAFLLAAEAVADGHHGRVRHADGHLRDAIAAIAHYERGDLLIHLAGWLVAPAALADGWGDPVTWLRSALRWFSEKGYEPLAADCRLLLRAAGAPAPRRGRGLSTVPDRLRDQGVTSREVDVLRLLGQRLTNRQIAERLVLSPKTVEKHVGSLLHKTGATSRTALADLASTL